MPLIHYDEYAPSLPQKMCFTAVHALGVAAGVWVLLGGNAWLESLGIVGVGDPVRSALLFTFSLTYFARSLPMLFFFLRRRVGWGEAVGFSLWLACYHVGAACLGVGNRALPGLWELLGIFLYLFGSALNTEAERQRLFWKVEPGNERRLLTVGMFARVRHPNYTGDVLAVLGWALVTGSPWALAVPVVVFLSYAFYSIPAQEAHLRIRYGEAFAAYTARTKRLVPWVY